MINLSYDPDTNENLKFLKLYYFQASHKKLHIKHPEDGTQMMALFSWPMQVSIH